MRQKPDLRRTKRRKQTRRKRRYRSLSRKGVRSMNEQNGQNGQNGQNDKKKNENSFSPLVLVALLLLTLSESGDTAMVALLFAALMIGAIVYVAYKGVNGYLKKRKGAAEEAAPAAPQPDEASEVLPPEACEAVCEDAGEDPLAREREQRIRQLDEWLKNGVIDKEEYQQLKDRYEGEP